MIITSSKKILLSALSRIQGIIEKNSIKPITSNVLISASNSNITLSATNLKIGITSKYSEIKVEEEGKISVSSRKLFEIVKELPEKEITIKENNNYRIEIKCGKNIRFNLIGLPPEDFPVYSKEEEENFVEWGTEKLIEMFNLSSFSISNDETKPNICGVFFENLESNITRLVTTDGYRLSIIDDVLGGENIVKSGFIIPHKGVVELNKILNEKKEEEKKISILINKKNLLAKIGEVEIFIRLTEKKFPDYRIIIPGEGNKKRKIRLKKDILKPALKRLCIISNENRSPVVFSFKEKKLELFTEDGEMGSFNEKIELEENEEFSFCINGLFLLDILNAVEKDIILELNIEEENKPIVVKPLNEENKKYIIMPMIMD